MNVSHHSFPCLFANLAQLSALAKRQNTAKANRPLYIAFAEPVVSDHLEILRLSVYLGFVAYAKLLCRLLNSRRKLQTRDFRVLEAEPDDFLDIIIQLELL